MKHRHPLFVAGVPYAFMLTGYVAISLLDVMRNTLDPPQMNALGAGILLASLGLLLFGVVYIFYWLTSTARVLRQNPDASVPNALLLIVPIANMWWMWRYAQAAEAYTKGKQQAALIFVLIAGLGSIGMGILQDMYNKLPAVDAAPHQASSKAPLPPA